MFMAEVLAPRLEFLGRIADTLAELRQRLSEAVRIEVGHAGRAKCVAKNLPYWGGARPMLSREAPRFKPQFGSDGNLGFRKNRIVVPEQLETTSRTGGSGSSC